MNLKKMEEIKNIQDNLIGQMSKDMFSKKLNVIKDRLSKLGYDFDPTLILIKHQENEDVYFYVPNPNIPEQRIRIVTFVRSMPKIKDPFSNEGFNVSVEETYY